MNRDIERMIPKAIVAIKALLLHEDTEIPKEYDGYAASLGAVIRNSGLIAALSFYTDVNRSEGTARRYKLLRTVAYCLGVSDNLSADVDSTEKRLLLDYIIAQVYGEKALQPTTEHDRGKNRFKEVALSLPDPNKTKLRKYTEQVISASIALKLAMRNFPQAE